MNYGVAVPFSTDGPTMFETQQTDSMEDYLFSSGAIYETPAGERNRFAVIDQLRSIVRDWAAQLGESKSVEPDICAEGGGIQLRIFGSTRLGVHNTDSDIDLLCLAPSFVSRSDFFTGFRELLASRDDTTAVLPIPEAFTPVLKFTISGQAIDMVFASIHLPRLPDNLDILDLRLLRGLDDASVRSINGPRVAEWIVRLVPNLENFCSTLRVIKYWARQRGLYSNMLGFLGGISYAILVAHVCQLFVCACPFTLVQKFFEVYAIRDWRHHPVMLRSYEDALVEDSEGRPLPVWNSLANPKDAAHIMPIITPAYPAMNSAFNVSWPQHLTIKNEIARACKIFQTHAGKRDFPWRELFEPFNVEFFSNYPLFVRVDIISAEEDDHRNWFGWVESRLRYLILSLDQLGPAPVPNKPVVSCCHPVANIFHRSIPREAVEEEVAGLDHDADATPVSVPAGEGVTPAVMDAMDTENGKAGHVVPATSEADCVAPDDGKVKVEPTSSQLEEILTSKEHPLEGGKCAGEELRASTDATAATVPSIIDPALARTPGREKHVTIENGAGQVGSKKRGAFTYVSTYLIGLSLERKSELNTEPAMQDFTYKVMSWAHRKESMKLDISVCAGKDLPESFKTASALPSDVKNCTPRLQRVSSGGGDVSAVTANLFPSSPLKPAPSDVTRCTPRQERVPAEIGGVSRESSRSPQKSVASDAKRGTPRSKTGLPRDSSDSGLSAAFSSSSSLADRGSGERTSPRSNSGSGSSSAVAALFPEHSMAHLQPPPPQMQLQAPMHVHNQIQHQVYQQYMPAPAQHQHQHPHQHQHQHQHHPQSLPHQAMLVHPHPHPHQTSPRRDLRSPLSLKPTRDGHHRQPYRQGFAPVASPTYGGRGYGPPQGPPELDLMPPPTGPPARYIDGAHSPVSDGYYSPNGRMRQPSFGRSGSNGDAMVDSAHAAARRHSAHGPLDGYPVEPYSIEGYAPLASSPREYYGPPPQLTGPGGPGGAGGQGRYAGAAGPMPFPVIHGPNGGPEARRMNGAAVEMAPPPPPHLSGGPGYPSYAAATGGMVPPPPPPPQLHYSPPKRYRNEYVAPRGSQGSNGSTGSTGTGSSGSGTENGYSGQRNEVVRTRY